MNKIHLEIILVFLEILILFMLVCLLVLNPSWLGLYVFIPLATIVIWSLYDSFKKLVKYGVIKNAL